MPLCIPVLNLAVLARLAGLTPARAVAALGLVLAVSVPAAVAAHRGGVRARADAAVRRMDDAAPEARRRAAAAFVRAAAPRSTW